MASHSYTNLLYHLVFSTRERQPWLSAEVAPGVFARLAELIRAEEGIPLIVNGVEDHVHLLVKLHQSHAVADVVRALKAKSSGWIHRTFPALECFSWQTGYGAFSVSQSQVPRVKEYIRDQEKHHRTKAFQVEFIDLLKVHDVEYIEDELWD